MNSNEMNFYNPNYKIGIKELTDDQLLEGLPNCDELFRKIEKIREQSESVDKEYLEKNSFEALKYDNIISILGGRGAGKTSILYTLYKRFKSEDNNIMVPIVMPELLDKNESIISWILSAIEVCLNDVEDKIIDESKGCQDKANIKKVFEEYDFFERCVFNKNNKLRKKFNDLKQAFYDNENKNFGSNYSENTELMAQSVQSGFEIIPKFIGFWNLLIKIYQKLLIESKSKNTIPLVFLFIDDADLKPEIINELLFVIPKFLSHPNVVIFISGSQKTLTLAVKNHMYKSITQQPYDLTALMDVEYKYNRKSYRDGETSRIRFADLRYGKEYDKIENLTNEILRKLFPVYNRFKIKKYDTYRKKQSFQIFKNEEPTCKESIRFVEKITELLNRFYYSIMQLHYDHMEFLPIKMAYEPSSITIQAKEDNFKLLVQDNDSEKMVLKNGFYLSFFGQYSRDISAVYFALEEMLENLNVILQKLYSNGYGNNENGIPINCIEDAYSVIVKFINSAVSSNSQLKMFNSSTEDMIKTQLLHWQLYIDYSRVLEIFKQPEHVNSNMKNPAPFIEMICLLNFIEQIIVLIMPQRKKSHGITEIHELIKNAQIAIIPYSNDLDEIFDQYYVFSDLNIIPSFDLGKIEHQNNFINGIFNLKVLEQIENKYFIENHEWVTILAKVYYKRYSPMARISNYRKELHIFGNELFLDDKYRAIKKSYYGYLQNCSSTVSENRWAYNKNNYIIEMDDSIRNAMEKLALQLNNSIKLIRLYFNDMNLELMDHIKELDMYRNKELKKEAYIFMRYLKTQKIYRSELIKKLRIIRNMIELDDFDYLSLIMWYDELVEIVSKNTKIHNVGVNKDYKQTLEEISKIFKDYINYYFYSFMNKITIENEFLPIKIDDSKLYKLIEPYLKELELQEWREFIDPE